MSKDITNFIPSMIKSVVAGWVVDAKWGGGLFSKNKLKTWGYISYK